MSVLRFFHIIAPDVKIEKLSEDNLEQVVNEFTKAVEYNEPGDAGITAALPRLRSNMYIHIPKARSFQLAVYLDKKMEEAE